MKSTLNKVMSLVMVIAVPWCQADQADSTTTFEPDLRILTAAEGSSCAGFEKYTRAQLYKVTSVTTTVDELICMSGIWRPASLQNKKQCGLTINTVNVFRCMGHDPRISCPYVEVPSAYAMPDPNESLNATYVPPNTMYTCYIK